MINIEFLHIFEDKRIKTWENNENELNVCKK